MGRLIVLVVVAGLVALLLRPLSGAFGPGWPVRIPVLLERRGTATLLVLGLDRRGAEVARSDTILLIRVGPVGGGTTLLSIPRDLWVSIPQRGEDRINAAYAWGDLTNGDGASLARRTVEQSFGLPVDRVAVVDFACFQQAVDAAGGVTVDVPARLVDERYPADDGTTTVVVFEPGRQTLSGSRALQYARIRSPDSDFGRIRRQHQVAAALAARLHDPIVSLRVAQSFLRSCPDSGTDLSPLDLAMLGVIAATDSDPRVRLVDESMVSPTTLPSGAQVLLPRWERIRPVVAELFGRTE